MQNLFYKEAVQIHFIIFCPRSKTKQENSLSNVYCLHWGFPDGMSGKESACQCRRLKRCGFDSCVGNSQRKAWQPTLAFWPEKTHGQKSLGGYIRGVSKSWTRLSAHARTHTHTHCFYWVKGPAFLS